MGLFGNLFASFKVDIRCDLSRNVFFPGNVVEGVVIVQARSPIDFRAVRLKLAGKQRVCITRTHTRQHHHNGETRTETYTEHHVSTAVVYKQLVTLAGNMKYAYNTNGTYPMPNGTFYYPFSVQLPNDLPPSVTRRQGGHSSEIYFYAKAYVDIPMGRDAVSKTFFSVLRPMPVSQWLSKGPIQDERQFHVTCCCCIDKGYVKARLFMDRTTIAIDRDNINVYADVDNTLGKEPVKSLIVNLRAVMTNFAQGHTEKFVWNQAHAVIANHIPAGQKGIIQGVLHLPRNALPTFASPHSNVSYSIMAELEIPMASNPSASFPVVVAQSIDESNYCAPIRWGECSYRVYPKRSACPEFYYLPPQHPVYAVNTIPMNGMAPPPPQFYMPPPQITMGVPNSEWVRGAAPFVPLGIKEHHVANGPVSPLQWQVGVQQPEMRFTAITQEQPGSGSPTTPMHEDGKGYGSIATPLM